MSNLIPLLSGTGVALVTPFKSDLSIDEPALARVIEHVIAGGVEYIVTLGTTGETPTLSRDEKVRIARFTIEDAPHAERAAAWAGHRRGQDQ